MICVLFFSLRIWIKQNEKSNLDPLEMAFIRCLCLKNNLFYEMFDVIFTVDCALRLGGGGCETDMFKHLQAALAVLR